MQIMYWPPALPDQSITEPTKIGILIPKLSTVKELRQRIAAKVGLEADQIVIADVYTSRAYVQPDSKLVSDFRTTGTLWAYVFLHLSFSQSIDLFPLTPSPHPSLGLASSRERTASWSMFSNASHPSIRHPPRPCSRGLVSLRSKRV